MSIELPPETDLKPAQNTFETPFSAHFSEKKVRLPWKKLILPVLFFMLCCIQLLFLTQMEKPALHAIPFSAVQLHEAPLPQAFCPAVPIQVETPSCPAVSAPIVSTPSSPLRIETLPKQIENTQTLSRNFFAQGQKAAQKKDWHAAFLAFQQAFFFSPEMPDYAFNTAIALEHLKQTEPAQHYYQKALELTQNHAAQFSSDALKQHLKQLEN